VSSWKRSGKPASKQARKQASKRASKQAKQAALKQQEKLVHMLACLRFRQCVWFLYEKSWIHATSDVLHITTDKNGREAGAAASH